jgi:hypothetical protein
LPHLTISLISSTHIHPLRPPLLLLLLLSGLYVRFTVGELGNTGVCRMCKVVAVDLHGRGYKLAETGEYCTVRLSLMCGGEVSSV